MALKKLPENQNRESGKETIFSEILGENNIMKSINLYISGAKKKNLHSVMKQHKTEEELFKIYFLNQSIITMLC